MKTRMWVVVRGGARRRVRAGAAGDAGRQRRRGGAGRQGPHSVGEDADHRRRRAGAQRRTEPDARRRAAGLEGDRVQTQHRSGQRTDAHAAAPDRAVPLRGRDGAAAEPGARRGRRVQRRAGWQRDAGGRGRGSRSADRGAASSDHHRARGAGSGGEGDQSPPAGDRSGRRRDHREGRHADAGRRRHHQAAVARHLDGRQRQHGRRRDRDVVLRIRGRERPEAAEAADDDHGQVRAVRSSGVEKHGRRRRRRSGGARCREGGQCHRRRRR